MPLGMYRNNTTRIYPVPIHLCTPFSILVKILLYSSPFMKNKAPTAILLCALSTVIFFPAFARAAEKTSFRGTKSLSYTRQAVLFGERPSGSLAIDRLRGWIQSELKPLGCAISLDRFTAQTPGGPVAMANIVARFVGTSGKAQAITGHYDTKKIPMMRFVGANDGGSSTGFLLELARVLSTMKHADDIYLVWFDGEEAVGQWSDQDSRYGSRHLVQAWSANGTLAKLRFLINIDMVGDKDLNLLKDTNSSPGIRDSVWQIADKLGYSKYFTANETPVDDDHRSFAAMGIDVLDLIDLNYGPNNSYWHTAQDTMDKLSAESFQIVGDVVVETIKQSDAGVQAASLPQYTAMVVRALAQ